MTKECSGYTGGAGSFCTITSSNLNSIEVDSRILYLQPELLFTPSGSDVVLDFDFVKAAETTLAEHPARRAEQPDQGIEQVRRLVD